MNAEIEGETYIKPNISLLRTKESYDQAIDRIQKKESNPNNLLEDFLNEKALNIDEVNIFSY